MSPPSLFASSFGSVFVFSDTVQVVGAFTLWSWIFMVGFLCGAGIMCFGMRASMHSRDIHVLHSRSQGLHTTSTSSMHGIDMSQTQSVGVQTEQTERDSTGALGSSRIFTTQHGHCFHASQSCCGLNIRNRKLLLLERRVCSICFEGGQ